MRKTSRWYGSAEQIEYENARAEHAFLLRCEGLMLREIGFCLGVSAERSRHLVMKGARRLNMSLQRRHTKMWFVAEAEA